jgi:hypothetical protein
MFDFFRQNKDEQLSLLRDHYDRLRTIIGELLAMADDRDQQQKYTGAKPAEWSQSMREACSALVKLGDELPKIEKLLEEKKIGPGRNAILNCCRRAHEIWQRLRQI